MATQAEREQDAQDWADNTSWDALIDGVENRNQDPSDGLETYWGTSVPSDFDESWEEGFDSDAEENYNNRTADPDVWLDNASPDNWN